MRSHRLAGDAPSILYLHRRDTIVRIQNTLLAGVGALEGALIGVSGVSFVVVGGVVTLGVEDGVVSTHFCWWEVSCTVEGLSCVFFRFVVLNLIDMRVE